MINLKSLVPITFLAIIVALSACSNEVIETNDNFEVVELPDGSIAYLNHNSTIAYDQEFDPRIVEIHGEIYFNVIKAETPFIVTTDLGDVKVLGTEFNVKSNKDELTVEVEKGTVELKTKADKHKIGRAESAYFKKNGKEIRKGNAEFKFKGWMIKLNIDFKKLGKEIEHGSKQIGKESKKIGKELKKEIKKIKTD